MTTKPLPASIRPQIVPADLPLTVWQAMKRGIVNCCPRCGLKGFFPRFLKPIAQCRACGQDWTHQRADDFPPYVAIIVTGHLMAPIMVVLAANQSLSLVTKMALAVALAAAMIAVLLQPAKGAIIAIQWWNGMHGFIPSGKTEAEVAGHPEG